MLGARSFEVLTFDCYGTLIDWESGILSALKPVLASHGIGLSDEILLELYAEIESALETGEYRPYKRILEEVVEQFGLRLGFKPSPEECRTLPLSLRNWLPFPDTVEALHTLHRSRKLAIVSNTDADLVSHSLARLEVPFDWVITSEEVKRYKPSLKNFIYAIEKIDVAPHKILHVAQSLYHDILPAKKLRLATVWINRRKGLQGPGATPPAECEPDLEMPDLKSLASLFA
jgi:2-haloacid dehalogenase